MTDGAAVRVRGLSKRYGATWAAREVDLSVEPGQVYGLLGPNGSGKTTTLSCALGLLQRTAGEVRVLGEPPERLYRTNGAVACVFDAPSHLGGHTIAQNLAYHARLRGHRGGRDAGAVLERVGLAGLERRRAAALSLGQRKRLSLAAALAGAPRLVVLDEPLSGLDPMGVREMLDLLRELAGEGLTLLLSSHRLHEMEELLSHVAVLHRGRVIHEGALDALLGERDAWRLVVGDTARAVAVLAGDGVLVEAEDRTHCVVRAPSRDAADLVRALVEAGVAVRGLAPARRGLQTAFESLVRAHAAPGEGSPA